MVALSFLRAYTEPKYQVNGHNHAMVQAVRIHLTAIFALVGGRVADRSGSSVFFTGHSSDYELQSGKCSLETERRKTAWPTGMMLDPRPVHVLPNESTMSARESAGRAVRKLPSSEVRFFRICVKSACTVSEFCKHLLHDGCNQARFHAGPRVS